MESVKLMLMGAGGVGKTTIKIQALYPQFLDICDPTLEDSYRKQVNVDGETYMLDVLDTVDEEYSALLDGWIQLADAYILIYSLTDMLTFNEIRAFHTKIQSVREKSAPEWLTKASINTWKSGPIVLVANKADLVEGRPSWTQVGRDMARELDVPIMELTARNTGEVDILIADTVRMVKEYRLQLNRGNPGQEISVSKHLRNPIQPRCRNYHRSASLFFKTLLKKAKTPTLQDDAKPDSTNITLLRERDR
ncbi:P-loop containing nucleoside triphosphate hydrolase protein [Dactylonectria macrodidyma]|uniref:P-loop containing nucleoside triphosphate hydrolase protein n=1 Tax=Dactylonectria macrodidyma TaxID=307937 RepID=A0A9P9DK29_9HYPO|nr:P-loop containing nucleoside triphosphate hydrolase protein [Dactylonectria macrodidyma]